MADLDHLLHRVRARTPAISDSRTPWVSFRVRASGREGLVYCTNCGAACQRTTGPAGAAALSSQVRGSRRAASAARPRRGGRRHGARHARRTGGDRDGGGGSRLSHRGLLTVLLLVLASCGWWRGCALADRGSLFQLTASAFWSAPRMVVGSRRVGVLATGGPCSFGSPRRAGLAMAFVVSVVVAASGLRASGPPPMALRKRDSW